MIKILFSTIKRSSEKNQSKSIFMTFGVTFSRSSCSFVAGSFTLSARAKESRRLAIDIDILSIAVSLSRISTQFNSCFLASPPTPDSMAHDMCHGMCFMGLHNGSVYINFCALFDNVICLGSACARERIDSRLCSIITCYVMFDYLWEAKETVVGGVEGVEFIRDCSFPPSSRKYLFWKIENVLCTPCVGFVNMLRKWVRRCNRGKHKAGELTVR